MKLISIRDALEQGIERLRKPIWASPLDHLKIDIVNGGLGPWCHLFAPMNQHHNGRDPVSVLLIGHPTHEQEWEVYDGPPAHSDEYMAEAAKFQCAGRGEEP